jgi:hypothetical protein
VHRSSRIARHACLVALLVFGLSGCAAFSDWFRDGGPGDPEMPSADDELGGGYLMDMFQMTSGDPATQAEVYADAEAAARLTPTTSSRLRYALVLATPGHAGSNPERAQDILRGLLSEAQLLTPTEVSLATIHLGQVEERLTLNAETRRLRAESSRAASSEERAVAERMAAIENENRQLRQSLQEAQEKLEAITSIERSIREQSDNNNTNHNNGQQ